MPISGYGSNVLRMLTPILGVSAFSIRACVWQCQVGFTLHYQKSSTSGEEEGLRAKETYLQILWET